MAIKLLDQKHLTEYNITIQNLILSFKGSYRVNYQIHNGQKIYFIFSTLYYYLDREKEHIKAEPHSYVINESQLDTNLLEYMYNMVKGKLNNYENI